MRPRRFALSVLSFTALASCELAIGDVSDGSIKDAFAKHSLALNDSNLGLVRADVMTALKDHCTVKKQGATGSGKTRYAAVQIASKLGANPQVDQTVTSRITNAIESLSCDRPTGCAGPDRAGCGRPPETTDWEEYYKKTLNLTADSKTLKLFQDRGYSPVKISWEDIGRYQNSVWGDRISDVGIWVRKNESDSDSAQLALSVRRDSNYRDKVLMVPTSKIKVHLNDGRETREVSLKDRLKELDLTSANRDDNAIVSNQFAIVPVPSKSMMPGRDHPPRAAFNFSIYPYGSTNYVITDVIEGSSEAIVGPGSHQLLFSNVDGKKAPFTASRAEDRQDLLDMEAKLKSKGMDVDVQRYYLIQIPLKKDAGGIELSNMGTPPTRRGWYGGEAYGAGAEGAVFDEMPAPAAAGAAADTMVLKKSARANGLTKVAIGHGEVEGAYSRGAGFAGKRSDEPVRVTVVYFVTPIGEVTEADTQKFADTFASWDKEAIWGGSFVTGE